MHRRHFLGLMAALAAAGAAPTRAPAAATPTREPAPAAADRLAWWPPLGLDRGVALEWRYLAGRITRGAEDFGFVVSIADYKDAPPLISGRRELLVMRQEFAGAQAHATTTYTGTLSYDSATATYSFVADAGPAIGATWRLDVAAQRYALTVNTPELALADLLLTPQGQLIPEGGDGDISSGNIVVNGLPVTAYSDYFADWVEVSSGGQRLGLARLDMQTIRPTLGGGGSGNFSHHWFCLACTLADDTPAWVSAWQIVSGGTTVWALTVAAGKDATWSVTSRTEEDVADAQPLSVEILDWQTIPAITPARRTGRRWRVRQGQLAEGDALDLVVVVPPGQFIKNARISTASSIPMQEAVGLAASGSVGGKAIKAVAFAVAESTYHELEPAQSMPRRAYLPAVTR